MTASALWGLWGGATPGGWAAGTSFGPLDGHGLAHAGTREQAMACALDFAKENRFSYKVERFDAARDPDGVTQKPTKAQRKVLARVAKYGDPRAGQSSMHSERAIRNCWRCGWITQDLTSDGRWPGGRPRTRLTAIGRIVMGARLIP